MEKIKILAKHWTLLTLVEAKGLGWAQTNEFGGAAKNHFLQMRREGFVDYTQGYNKDRIRGVIVRGPDINAYFYTITVKGLSLLLKLFPNNEDVESACREFISGVLSENEYLLREYDKRK